MNTWQVMKSLNLLEMIFLSSIEHLRHSQSLSSKGWMVVDAWTTVMSPDNECGHYCREPDGHYYTIAITNRSSFPAFKLVMALSFNLWFIYYSIHKVREHNDQSRKFWQKTFADNIAHHMITNIGIFQLS